MITHSDFDVMSSNVLLCLTNTLKSKDNQFTFMCDKEKHQILLFKELDITSVWCFYSKID